MTAGERDARTRLREIVAAVWEADIADVAADASFHEDLQLDSLQRTEVFARIERQFQVTLDPATVVRLRSLDAVHEVLRERGALGGAVPGDAR